MILLCYDGVHFTSKQPVRTDINWLEVTAKYDKALMYLMNTSVKIENYPNCYSL